jgi:hypothetical protein
MSTCINTTRFLGLIFNSFRYRNEKIQFIHGERKKNKTNFVQKLPNTNAQKRNKPILPKINQ